MHRSFFTYVATVVEVEVDRKGGIRIPQIDTVVDAGKVVNFDRAKSQFEGAAVFGASLALMSEITALNGMIQQSNFHQYKVARINESPVETSVTVLQSDAPRQESANQEFRPLLRHSVTRYSRRQGSDS